MRKILSTCLASMMLIITIECLNPAQIAYAADSKSTTATQSQAITAPVGTYKKGSVYGPKLNKKQLNEVKAAVNQIVTAVETNYPGANNQTRFLAAALLMAQNCTYVADWSQNSANTAWGSLVFHQAACSGYARGLKAVCDGLGIHCYYVHSTSKGSCASHQFNKVYIDGIGWTNVDLCIMNTSGYWIGQSYSDTDYQAFMVQNLGDLITWDPSLPACNAGYVFYN